MASECLELKVFQSELVVQNASIYQLFHPLVEDNPELKALEGNIHELTLKNPTHSHLFLEVSAKIGHLDLPERLPFSVGLL